ncbi:MAG: hypothetical protein AAFQ36_05040 [Pseudomonadota bacterium]
MKLKLLAAAVALSFAPSLALAYECGWSHSTSASACGAGQTYDSATGTCVDAPSA